jgi:nucleotide-binding universal stress UspA family protein
MRLPKLIVSPIDFSSPSDDALKTARDLASRFGSELLLVHVVPAIPKLPSATTIFHEAEYEQELRARAVERLEQMVQELAAQGVKARFEVGTANDVSMEILRTSELNQGDLIVIATHGMSGWRKLAFGSVTEKVVRLAECPVLVLRAQPASTAEDSPALGSSVAAAH